MTQVLADHKVRLILHGRITADPDQPRRVFNEEALEALSESILSEGLLQPITVRPEVRGQKLNQHTRYIVVAGERRWRAVGMLGWGTIPAIVHDLSMASVTKAQLLENAVRVDLNPVEEAQAIRRALKAGVSLADLSFAVGMKPEQVKWRVEILACIQPVLHLVSIGQVTMWAARAIAKLTHDGQMKVLRHLNSGDLKTRDIQMRLRPDMEPRKIRRKCSPRRS